MYVQDKITKKLKNEIFEIQEWRQNLNSLFNTCK